MLIPIVFNALVYYITRRHCMGVSSTLAKPPEQLSEVNVMGDFLRLITTLALAITLMALISYIGNWIIPDLTVVKFWAQLLQLTIMTFTSPPLERKLFSESTTPDTNEDA